VGISVFYIYTLFIYVNFFRNTSKEYRKGLVYPIYCLHSHIGYGIDMICHLFIVLTVVKLSNTFIINMCYYMCYVLVLPLQYVYI